MAIHDLGVLGEALARSDDLEAPLKPREAALSRLAATVATGGSDASFSAAADDAISAGVTVRELVDALLAVVPVVGLPRAAAAAQHLIVALDLEDEPVGRRGE
jgi:alkylhydroperoxidase/carboxymuconolactone decarboxylase family protein YurZ